MNNDELEEQGKIEICSHCKSMNIHSMELDNEIVLLCKNCGTSGLTEIIDEADYDDMSKNVTL